MKKLNLGCGLNHYFPGWTNHDFNKNIKADVYHDLEKFPYPFKNEEFDFILMNHVLEHLNDTVRVVEELHRILAPGGTIKIIVPHGSSFMGYGHLTHKKLFGTGTLGNFRKGAWEKYSDIEFSFVNAKLVWLASRKSGVLGSFMNKILNYNHYLSERFLINFLGVDHIVFTLKK